MAIGNIAVSEAELEIMKALWNSDKPLNSIEIGEEVKGQNWKKTTIATFLTRLCEKGAIKAEKLGKLYYYTALIPEEAYKKSRTDSLIKSLYHGSVKELAAALFADERLSPEDIEQLRSIFDDKGD